MIIFWSRFLITFSLLCLPRHVAQPTSMSPQVTLWLTKTVACLASLLSLSRSRSKWRSRPKLSPVRVEKPHFWEATDLPADEVIGVSDILQRLQNKAAWVITGDSYYSSATETLFKLGWETLQCRRDEQLFSLVDKNIGGDSNLSDFFRISNRDCYDFRSNNNILLLPKPNTNAIKRTLGYRGAMLWNLNHESNSLSMRKSYCNLL